MTFTFMGKKYRTTQKTVEFVDTCKEVIGGIACVASLYILGVLAWVLLGA